METTARGDVPKTLHNIAFVSIPNSADLDFLLWDLQDAIAAYARLSGTSLPRLVALGTDDGGSVADGIVFAVENALNNEAMSVVEQALDCLGGTEARVYVVVQASCGSPERAHTVVGHLREACERRGAVVVRWHCRLHRRRHRSALPLPTHGPLAPTVFRSDG